jgi:hypothetical protein
MNWKTTLEKAVKDLPSAQESRKLSTLAREWPTCACGEVCAKLPRNPANGAPLDERLFDLGAEFALEVRFWNYEAALLTLQCIENRTAELLKELP